jgi:hypothetical protein
MSGRRGWKIKSAFTGFGDGPPRFDVRTVQHWVGHKSLETTMRYLAPATDVHDELLVTIPSVGKAAPALRKSAAREPRPLRKGGRSHARAEGPVPADALKPGT